MKIKRDDIAKGFLKMNTGAIECFGGYVYKNTRATKEEKRKSDEAISIVWEAKKADWTMADLSSIFGKHIDTIYIILKKAREAKIITK